MSTYSNWVTVSCSTGLYFVTSKHKYDNWYILVDISKYHTSVSNLRVRFESGCSCSSTCLGKYIIIPIGHNRIIVNCRKCERILYRVTGLWTREWTLEIPK